MRVMNVMLSRGVGGLEFVALQYARLFAERGDESLLVLNRASPLAASLPANVRVAATLGSSLFNPLNYLRLVLAIRAARPDVVFFHAGRAARFCQKIRALLPRTVRLVGVAHGAGVKAFHEMDCVVAVSESVRRELTADWQAPEGRVRVLENAVRVPSAPPLHPARPTAHPPVIGFLGRFDDCKGVDVLIDACALLKERGIAFSLRLGGAGPLNAALRARVAEKGIAANVAFLGWIRGEDEKDAFFDSIDVFAMPSREEAFGVALVEAMAHAKPAVVSDCEEPARIVRTADCGLVVPKDDPAALADALAALLADPARCEALGANGHASAAAHYSERALSDALADVAANGEIVRKRSLTPGRFRVLALMAADAVCLVAVWAAAVNGYKALGFGQYAAHHYWNLWPIVPLFLFINAISRLYHGSVLYPAMPLSPVEEFRRLFASSLFAHLLLMAFLGFSRHNLDYSRFVIGFSGVAVGLLAPALRDLVRQVLFRLRVCQIPVALAGSGETAKRVAAVVGNDPYVGLEIALTFDEAHLKDIVRESQKRDVKILLACQDERLFRVQLRDFAAWFNYVEYLPRLEVFPVFGSHAVSIDGIGGLEMKNQGRMKALVLEKRLVDFALALVGFALTLPLFAVIPLLIKLDSKGPVFYRARRLGKWGKPFDCLKFRTMRTDADRRLAEILAADPAKAAEFKATFKLRDDPRITRFGRFLRRTSLDELPQFLNVFRGEMALVGPRPIVEKEVALYGGDYEVFRRVRPGITGLWQCSGRSDTSYTRRVALDVYYILNWSPWMDLWICLKTATSVLSLKGAV